MRLLIFGRTGQVARALERALPADVTATFLGRDAADLTDPERCSAFIAECDADAVINAAAWTAVDKAEADEATATLVNGTTVGAMARAAAARDLPFLHLSSDYVFDGSGDTPFRPTDPPAPLGAYGRSKLAGEQAIAEAGGCWLILRTSWVFSRDGSNFVKTMLRLGRERESLDVVTDQVGGPTPASAIAEALLVAAKAIANGARGGLHHFAGIPDVSWAALARAVMAEASLACRINGIPTLQYPTPARRPRNSRLECSDFTHAFGVARPDWRPALARIVQELLT